MKNNIIFVLCITGFLMGPYSIPSCDKIIESAINIRETSGDTALSNADIVEGLKTALRVGTDSSVNKTSKRNGFYKDEAIKILLPPEAGVIYENKDHALVKAIGLDRKIEEAILALNRAAEDASKEAGPIFRNAISDMSIYDGMSILKGKDPDNAGSDVAFDSTAATTYLRKTTGDKLRDTFAPKVNASLDKKLIGNYSPNQIWNTLTASYNEIAKNSFGMIKPVSTTDLGTYVTEKTLEGLFLKVATEEKKIRQDPLAWAKTSAGKILERVFGKQ